MVLNPTLINDLNHIADANGYFQNPSESDEWLSYTFIDNGQNVMLSGNDAGYLVAVFDQFVAHEILGFDTIAPLKKSMLASPAMIPVVPRDSVNVFCVSTRERLYNLLKFIREFETNLSHSPAEDESSIGQKNNQETSILEQDFYQMPENTEVERIAKQRRGQDLYKAKLMQYWDGRCAVTGLDMQELLVASHIKPWAEATDEERLNVYNGFLLAPHIDSVFDKGFITFDDNGKILFSPLMKQSHRELLHLTENMMISKPLSPEHKYFLSYHRMNVFKSK